MCYVHRFLAIVTLRKNREVRTLQVFTLELIVMASRKHFPFTGVRSSNVSYARTGVPDFKGIRAIQ